MENLRMDSKYRVLLHSDYQKDEEFDLIPYDPFINVVNLPFHIRKLF